MVAAAAAVPYLNTLNHKPAFDDVGGIMTGAPSPVPVCSGGPLGHGGDHSLAAALVPSSPHPHSLPYLSELQFHAILNNYDVVSGPGSTPIWHLFQHE